MFIFEVALLNVCNVAAVLPLAPTISSLVWTLPAAQVEIFFR
jgi:hypothetical protein